MYAEKMCNSEVMWHLTLTRAGQLLNHWPL